MTISSILMKLFLTDIDGSIAVVYGPLIQVMNGWVFLLNAHQVAAVCHAMSIVHWFPIESVAAHSVFCRILPVLARTVVFVDVFVCESPCTHAVTRPDSPCVSLLYPVG